MTIRLLILIAAGACALGFGSSANAAEPSRSRIGVPPVPANLEPPDGHVVFLQGHALGTQNYVCLPTAGAVAWTFIGPQATLFLEKHGRLGRQLTTHFLSPNPAEHGMPRPAWQHSLDSSRVWGRVAASSTDPAFVAADAIAWLLLEAAGAARGPAGDGDLARTTFIQRVNTSGGIAPATGCSQAGQIGTIALVPYSTDYFFYRHGRRR